MGHEGLRDKEWLSRSVIPSLIKLHGYPPDGGCLCVSPPSLEGGICNPVNSDCCSGLDLFGDGLLNSFLLCLSDSLDSVFTRGGANIFES